MRVAIIITALAVSAMAMPQGRDGRGRGRGRGGDNDGVLVQNLPDGSIGFPAGDVPAADNNDNADNNEEAPAADATADENNDDNQDENNDDNANENDNDDAAVQEDNNADDQVQENNNNNQEDAAVDNNNADDQAQENNNNNQENAADQAPVEDAQAEEPAAEEAPAEDGPAEENNANNNAGGAIDASLVPDFGIERGQQIEGTGDCVGAVEGVPIPCTCPPSVDEFLEKLAEFQAAGQTPAGAPVDFPTGDSNADQIGRINTALVVLQSITGQAGVGCPASSTTLLAQRTALSA